MRHGMVKLLCWEIGRIGIMKAVLHHLHAGRQRACIQQTGVCSCRQVAGIRNIWILHDFNFSLARSSFYSPPKKVWGTTDYTLDLDTTEIAHFFLQGGRKQHFNFGFSKSLV